MARILTSASEAHGASRAQAESFAASTIGRKVAMAATGLLLFGFVLVHMIGNLLVFLPDHGAIDRYGEFLRTALHGAGLWIARIALLAAVGVHIAAAWSLTMTNRRARPVPYRVTAPDASTYASRTMRWGGVILLLFIVFHILHMTTGTVHPAFEPGEVYHNVVAGFSSWPVSIFYVVAMLCLAAHLRHGVWSMLQTLGVSHPRWDAARKTAATIFAVVVAAGFIAVPLAVLAGVVK